MLLSCCGPKMEDTFPFNQTKTIEVLSYPVRYEWDTIRNGKKVHLGNLVENKKLVNPSGIKERVILSDKQKLELFNTLFIRETKNCEIAMCFDPRHAILFYNDKEEIIANIEICFECGGDYGTFKYNELCIEGLEPIGKIIEDAGIKYFGE